MDWQLPEADTYFAKILEKTPAGFELDHLEVALEHCHRFRVAVDGGAHIGTWTCAMATRFNRVHAFEPAPDSFRCLLANTKRFGNLTLAHAALGDKNQLCTVLDDPTRVGNTGSRMVSPGGAESVWMYALDHFQFEELDFLKLDVEGYELFALQGAEQTIWRCKPVIMIECKRFVPPRHGGPEAAIQYLSGLGYHEVGGVRNDRVFINE